MVYILYKLRYLCHEPTLSATTKQIKDLIYENGGKYYSDGHLGIYGMILAPEKDFKDFLITYDYLFKDINVSKID